MSSNQYTVQATAQALAVVDGVRMALEARPEFSETAALLATALAVLHRYLTPQPMDAAPRDGTWILAESPSDGWVITRWHKDGYTGSAGSMDGWYEGISDGVERVYHDYDDLDPEVPVRWLPLPLPTHTEH